MAIVRELDLIGKQFGNYKILGELGRGGMAIVYKADELSLNRVVALKVLSPKISDDEDMIKRFHREAQAAAKLNHPNIVHIYSIGQEQGIHYFTMEYIKGKSLRQLYVAEGPLPIARAISIISDVALALDEAHKAGLVHRDIKPSNIMIDAAGRVKVTDFGIAHMSAASTKLTVTGTFLGTPEYMSPEQCEAKPIDGRSDIYSLGVTFYESLTGKGPFEAETPASMLVKIMSGDKVPLRVAKPDTPPAVEAVIDKMLQINREQRFRNCGELVEALRRLAAQFPGSDDRTVVDRLEPAPVMPAAQNKPAFTRRDLAAAAAAVLVMAGFGFIVWHQRSRGHEEIQKGVQGELTASAVRASASPAPVGPTVGPSAVAPTPQVPPSSPSAAISPAAVAPAPATVDVEASAKPEAPAVPSSPTVAQPPVPTEPAPQPVVAAKTAVAAPEPPAANSVRVSSSGDPERAELLCTWLEAQLPRERLAIVEAASTADKKPAEASRYAINLGITRLGSRLLKFAGTRSELEQVSLTLKITDTASGRLVAGPFTKSAEYTSLNMEANLKEAIRDLAAQIPADFGAIAP